MDCAGVCRTDVAVAEGRLAARRPVVLGHELTGIVDAQGADVTGWLGATVVVMPVDPRGRCLGVDHDGGFAQFVVVPVASVRAVSPDLPPTVRAFAEPVAACLAPVAFISPEQRVGVVGGGRIAALTVMCLEAAGMGDVTWLPDTPDTAFDVLVETTGRSPDLDPLLDHLSPGGVLVLKSRRADRVSFDVARALARDLSIHLALYADFDRAVDILGRIDLAPLTGTVHPLSAWATAFACDESVKVFLDPWREA